MAPAEPQPPAPVAKTYTSDYEKAPNPDLLTRADTARWAQAEQDRYRLRVVIPDAIDAEEEISPQVEAGTSQSQASRASPSSRQPEESRALTYVVLLVLAVVLSVSRLRPDLRERYLHPWDLLPAPLRGRLQQACAPQDASAAGGRRLVKAMQQGARPGFLQPEPEQLDV
ncbi:MAG TPA: hypothetical protein VNM37_15970, partial [Candidatus Dormibacteraeota bacterium]|nr:hypothetical protein [Candidatus Dormibacteraeota bacterium]